MENEKYETVEKQVDHPLDDVFGMEPGSMMVEYEERTPTELVEPDDYDDKDKEIEEQFQEVYDLAIEAYENSAEAGQTIDPKFKARNDEVAERYLNLALTAARDKLHLKKDKDKLAQQAKKGNGSVVNNNIVLDHNTLLDMIDNMEMPPIEGEVVESTE